MLVLFSFVTVKGQVYDLAIKNCLIYDGKGGQSFKGTIYIDSNRIVEVLKNRGPKGRFRKIIDAGGMAVAPGFINMLSQAGESLLVDGSSLSDLKQGVTLEVLGEGWSFGPYSEAMRMDASRYQGAIKYDVTWHSLKEYLQTVQQKGIACNIASFVGAGTIRANVIGMSQRAATSTELEEMKQLVKIAMQEGALGLSSALIYPPGVYASANELIELSKIAASYHGMYASHLRSEGNGLIEAVQEFMTIAKRAGIRAEIFHLKAIGKENWHKLDTVIGMIQNARREGVQITADIYPYTSAFTGLDACIPPLYKAKGLDSLFAWILDPGKNKLISSEMQNGQSWENYLLLSGPENIVVNGFTVDQLKNLNGLSLSEIARRLNMSPERTVLYLTEKQRTRINAVYFFLSEKNLDKLIQIPWISFCSDEGSYGNNAAFSGLHVHPRAYGSFAKLLNQYVSSRKLIPLEQAICRLSYLPAKNLRLKNRGLIKPGYFADIVIFNPESVKERATYEIPNQIADGFLYVLVNGAIVIDKGNYTGKKSGMLVFGPGYKQ